MRSALKRKNAYFYTDLAAVLLGAALLALFVFAAGRGFPDADEINYCNMRQCFLEGDRVFVDEWDYCQMVFLLDLPVYALFTRITGGTEGVILFMRYYFIVLDLLFYAYLYRKLRSNGWAGLAAAFFFCSVVPQTIFAIGYFTASILSFTAVCMILMNGKKEPGRGRLFLAGVLLAVAVMAEPFLIFVFLLYVLAVCAGAVLRKKIPRVREYDFVLGGRPFFWIGAGAFAVFVVFMITLLCMGSLKMLPQILPYLLGGKSYSLGKILGTAKLAQVAWYFGKAPIVLLAVCLLCAAVLRFCSARARYVRLAVFAVTCFVLAAVYLRLLIDTFIARRNDLLYYIDYFSAPVLVASVIWCLLDEKKDCRSLALCSAAVLFSFFVDITSHALVGTGGPIAFIAGSRCFFSLAGELVSLLRSTRAEKGSLARGRQAVFAAALCAAGLWFVSLSLWNGSFVVVETVRKPIETVFSAAFTRGDTGFSEKVLQGPNKGLITSPHIAEIYYKTLEDMDQIKADADGGPVVVLGDVPYTYLYLGLPHASYGAWVSSEAERLLDYWQLFPERTPVFMYIPYYDILTYNLSSGNMMTFGRYRALQDAEALFSSVGTFEPEYGKMGVIIRVLRETPVS